MDRFIDTESFGRVMKKVVQIMRPWGWCMFGGRAVEVWSNPPQTPDVDILTDLTDDDVENLALRSQRFSIRLASEATGQGAPMVFLKDTRENVEIDIMGAYEELHYATIRRAVWKTIRGVRIPVAYAEDMIILKAQSALDYGRAPAKKIRDRRAIQNIASSVKINKAFVLENLQNYQMQDEIQLLKRLGVL
jgi:hypothetical protein